MAMNRAREKQRDYQQVLYFVNKNQTISSKSFSKKKMFNRQQAHKVELSYVPSKTTINSTTKRFSVSYRTHKCGVSINSPFFFLLLHILSMEEYIKRLSSDCQFDNSFFNFIYKQRRHLNSE